jgi:hypothetical protein
MEEAQGKGRGMKKIYIALVLSVFCQMPATASAAEWSLYWSKGEGIDRYIDSASVHQTTKGTILVWDRMEILTPSGERGTSVSLREVDCSRRRYKVLQWRVRTDTSNTDLDQIKGWIYYQATDPDQAHYNAICGKKK